MIASPAREGFGNLWNHVGVNGAAFLSWGCAMDVSRQWAFADAPNLAVVTQVQVLRHGMPVLYVTHDVDDGGWQFLTGEAVDVADSMIAGLEEMVRHDPSLVTLADLPIGWCAWREGRDAEWQRGPR